MEMIQTRKSLGTRIRESLDAAKAESKVGFDWSVGADCGGRIEYHVEQAGEIYVFSPGEAADWLGIPLMDDGSWKK